jgi:HAD superfamily hydrolase (TIGR01549 family)
MSRSSPVASVVFDLDGTLVDSLPLVLRAITHAIEPFGPARPTMDIFAHLGGPPERFLPGLLEDPRNTPEALQRMDEYHRRNHDMVRPFDGVRVVLETIRTRDVKIGIWTGRDRESTEWLLDQHKLARYFETVVCGDDLPSHKPDPQGLRQIMTRLGVSPREILFVGDADVDVLGGSACDVDTVLIRHGREVDANIRAKAWRTVISPLEAYEVVLGCLG